MKQNDDARSYPPHMIRIEHSASNTGRIRYGGVVSKVVWGEKPKVNVNKGVLAAVFETNSTLRGLGTGEGRKKEVNVDATGQDSIFKWNKRRRRRRRDK
jgi:hypothetical protein